MLGFISANKNNNNKRPEMGEPRSVLQELRGDPSAQDFERRLR